MKATHTAADRKQLEAISAEGAKLDVPDLPEIDRRAFLLRYFATTDAQTLSGDPRTLAAAALGHLAWARTRRPRRAKIRVFNPEPERDGWASSHTVVETANDDMPFLVDSSTMLLNSLGHGVRVTIHPILDVTRDRHGRILALSGAAPARNARGESLIHFEIRRVLDPAAMHRIEAALRAVLADVRAAVEDWRAMRERLQHAAERLGARGGRASAAAVESCRFLEWLADDHFTLLGSRDYRLEGRGRRTRLAAVDGSGLGLLRRSEAGRFEAAMPVRPPSRAAARQPLVVTKAPVQSTVHRPAPLDFIAVRELDSTGRRVAETRFLGLFTSGAYNESPSDIPLLRHKVRQVMQQSRLDPKSHRGKALRHVLDTLPRDELIQSAPADLGRISAGILGLEERHRVRLFTRKDVYGNFYSCLVYLPRDQYSARARREIERLLAEAFEGSVAHSELTISESVLARLTVIVRIETEPRPPANLKRLEGRLRDAVTTWADRVRGALLARLPEPEALALHDRFAPHCALAYQEAVDPVRAGHDMQLMAECLDGRSGLRMVLAASGMPGGWRFTTFHRGAPIPLYLANPILENLGVRVRSESNYAVAVEDDSVWIQDFELELEPASARPPAADGVAARFRECFARTLVRDADNDGFNRFVVTAGLEWRQAALLRAYSKYVLQTGIRFSQAYMLQVLGRYPQLCRALVDWFGAQFDPDLAQPQRAAQRIESERIIRGQLDRVASLDEDRILRAFTSVLYATLRTNYYQLAAAGPKPYLAFKLDPSRIPDLPRPRPKFEIFVYSQRVEGVHLRCAAVARGGIRWSDRIEDFRTEVLGLMKAQQVKNTVIVPNGAKGGFVCKTLPPAGDRAAVQAEVTACYETFIRGLLDVTDNLVAGATVAPPRVVARDEPDPYLVVAADKGTATFSDAANAIAAEYGFWLGDAFASGGSAGYDHKKMAITARGAWEAVKRHFRELGLDTQTQPFTAVGIGDMSGDVFGNGMLLSPQVRLVAAFNHRHIFVDPNPDAAASFAERRRLFEMPRSGWDDYDRSKLSAGGGIFSRESKSVELDAAARAALGIDAAALTPPELIRAILRAPVDLLWNGGIGTYVKASTEADIDAGDPVNDGVRINGRELRCRVVAEGGNLGLTQRGRIEYALAGGRLNTDFIDNSGGVDSSDREVNIKILLHDAIEQGRLQRSRRNALLAAMADDVATRVLASNYAQTQALSVIASRARERIGEHARLMRLLETRGLLDRGLEFLPYEEEIEERRAAGRGLTRPELAVILSYAKIHLSSELVATDIPDDPYCATDLETYFPSRLAKRFPDLVRSHRLRREIVAMLISSSMVNRMGPFFVLRAQEETGTSIARVARAYAIVRELFGTRRIWREIEALDGLVQPQIQYDSFFEISRMVRRAVYWFLQHGPEGEGIDAILARMSPGVAELLATLPGLLRGLPKKRFQNEAREFESLGLPRELGTRIASLGAMTQLLDIVAVATELDAPVRSVAQTHFEIGRGLRLDWIRERIEALGVEGRWRAMARATLRETLAEQQRALVVAVLGKSGAGTPSEALNAWLAETNARVVQLKQALDEMQAVEQVDFATLTIALKEVGRLL